MQKRLFPIISVILLVFILFMMSHQMPALGQQAETVDTNVLLTTMLSQTINSINQYGWNPAVNGYHINWYRNNPTTYQNAGHDGQNELRMYQAMVGYKYLHPQDTSFDSAIQRLLPTFNAEWKNSTLAKGWVYFTFLRLREYTQDTATWDATMENWAASVYHSIPTDTGVPHGPIVDDTGANAPTCPDGFRVDQTLEDGLALIDAGKRYNNAAWAQAGTREVQIVTQQALNTRYNLFARIICQGKVWNDEARDGEIGQEAEALLYAGSYTENQQYLTLAQQMLDAVANPATGLIDQINGGLFFKLTMSSGVVDTAKKVTQQYHILLALHMANQLMNNRYATLEANMVQALQKAYFQPPVAGWMYEVGPDFTLYKGTENWISTEASGIAMQAILVLLEGNSPLLQENASPSGAATTPVPTPGITPTSIPSTMTPMPNVPPTIAPTSTGTEATQPPEELGSCAIPRNAGKVELHTYFLGQVTQVYSGQSFSLATETQGEITVIPCHATRITQSNGATYAVNAIPENGKVGLSGSWSSKTKTVYAPIYIKYYQ